MSDQGLHPPRPPDGPPHACVAARLVATAVLDGEAAETDVQALRTHLASCAACRTTVGRHEALVAAVREAPLERPRTVGRLVPSSRPGLRQTGRALLVAATLAAVALVGAFVSEARRDGGPAPAQSGPLIAERPASTDVPPG